MLSVGQLNEGYVLDHIEAGKSMEIYRYLKLDKLDCCVAIIKNARSNKMGKKDIIKVECDPETLNLDVLGVIAHNITVNIIRDGKISEKKALKLPKQIVNVLKCKNPRCITSIEQGLDQVFFLADEEKEIYRCKYCEEKYRSNSK
jgi:aspartate carbamoyltransferase regulatory subunit